MNLKGLLRYCLNKATARGSRPEPIESIQASIPTLERLGHLEGDPWTPQDTCKLLLALSHFRRYQKLRRWTVRSRTCLFRKRFSDLVLRANETYLGIGSLPRRIRKSPISKTQTGRLLFISGHFPSHLHGGGLRVYDIVQELSKEYTVDLFTRFNSPEDALSLPSLEKVVRNLFVAKGESEFNFSTLSHWLKTSSLNINDYDIVHLEYPQSHVIADQINSIDSPVIYTMIENLHRARFLKLRQYLAQNDTIRASEAWLDLAEVFAAEEKLWKFADGRIAVTEADQKAAEHFFGAPSIVIPTALSTSALLDPLSRLKGTNVNPNLFGFLGYFGHHPNFEALEWYCEKVHPLVLKQHPAAMIRIFGLGNLDSIKQKFRSLGGIEFVGFIPEIPEALAELSFCVSPLISGSGVRGKLNQYSICGKTTVTTSIGACGLDYEHNKEIVIADEPTEFASSIVSLLKDPDKAANMGHRAAIKAASKYTWPPQIRRLKELYNQLSTPTNVDHLRSQS